MEINANLERLKKDLKDVIDQLQKRKKEDKRKATFVAIFVAAVSALTTILIGLSSYIKECANTFSILALITSAGLTVIQAWDNF